MNNLDYWSIIKKVFSEPGIREPVRDWREPDSFYSRCRLVRWGIIVAFLILIWFLFPNFNWAKFTGKRIKRDHSFELQRRRRVIFELELVVRVVFLFWVFLLYSAQGSSNRPLSLSAILAFLRYKGKKSTTHLTYTTTTTTNSSITK